MPRILLLVLAAFAAILPRYVSAESVILPPYEPVTTVECSANPILVHTRGLLLTDGGRPVRSIGFDSGALGGASCASDGTILAMLTELKSTTDHTRSSINLVQLRAEGSVIGQKGFIFPVSTVVTAGSPTKDGGLHVAAWQRAAFLARFASDGSLKWARTYDFSGHEQFRTVRATSDGGAIAAGVASGAPILMKIAHDGRVQWVRQYGERGVIDDVVPSGHGYLVAGQIPSGERGESGWIARTDPSGKVVWQRRIDSGYHDRAQSIVLLAKGEFLVAGSIGGGSEHPDLFAVRFNAAGAPILVKTFGDPAHKPYDPTRAIVLGGKPRLFTKLFASRHTWLLDLNDECHQTHRSIDIEPSHVEGTEQIVTVGSLSLGEWSQPVATAVETSVATPLLCAVVAADASTAPAATRRESSTPVSAQVAPRRPANTAPPADALAEKAGELLIRGDFAALDALIESVANSFELLPTGSVALANVYVSLGRDEWPETFPEERRLQMFERWAAKSDHGKVALAQMRVNRAFRARGPGFASSVTSSNWKMFEAELALAQQALAGAKKRSPQWYATALSLPASEQRDPERIYREAVTQYPRYQEIYKIREQYMHPEWGGTDEEYARFADEAARLAGGDFGEALYALLVSRYVRHGHAEALDRGILSWPRTRKGLEIRARMAPDSSAAQQLIALSVHFDDFITARRLLEGVEWNFQSPSVWHTRERFDAAAAAIRLMLPTATEKPPALLTELAAAEKKRPVGVTPKPSLLKVSCARSQQAAAVAFLVNTGTRIVGVGLAAPGIERDPSRTAAEIFAMSGSGCTLTPLAGTGSIPVTGIEPAQQQDLDRELRRIIVFDVPQQASYPVEPLRLSAAVAPSGAAQVPAFLQVCARSGAACVETLERVKISGTHLGAELQHLGADTAHEAPYAVGAPLVTGRSEVLGIVLATQQRTPDHGVSAAALRGRIRAE